MSETLLAHLARQLARHPENVATEALAFILRSPAASAAFLAHVRGFAPALPEMERYTTQVHDTDGVIPDLVGTVGDRSPLIVEVKFRAGLTPAQPVTYLKRLDDIAPDTLLLFLVPRSRVGPLWERLCARCAGESLTIERHGSGPSGKVRSTTIAVTSWGDVLEALESGDPEDPGVADALRQLRGLVEVEDQRQYVPLTQDDLDGDWRDALQSVLGLMSEALDTLRAAGIVGGRTRADVGATWSGRWFSLAGRRAFLHVNTGRWVEQEKTPLWLRIRSDNPAVRDALSKALNPRPGLFEDGGRLQIPIVIPPAVERDEALDAIVTQVQRVGELLEAVPLGGRQEGGEADLESVAEEEP